WETVRKNRLRDCTGREKTEKLRSNSCAPTSRKNKGSCRKSRHNLKPCRRFMGLKNSGPLRRTLFLVPKNRPRKTSPTNVLKLRVLNCWLESPPSQTMNCCGTIAG